MVERMTLMILVALFALAAAVDSTSYAQDRILASPSEGRASRPMAAPAGPTAGGGGLGQVKNWSYVIGVGNGKSMSPSMEAAVLNYATSSCDGTINGLGTKSEPGNISEFIAVLQDKLDDKLEDNNPPDAPTLDQVVGG